MEVATGEDCILLGENQRVIGRGVGFPLDGLADPIERISDRPMNLRNTAQGIGILDPITVDVGGANLAPLQEGPDAGRHPRLAGMGSDLVDPLIEGLHRSQQPLEADGGREIGRIHHCLSLEQGSRQHRHRNLYSVDQRQTFLGLQNNRLEATSSQSGLASEPPTSDQRLALPDQHQSQV